MFFSGDGIVETESTDDDNDGLHDSLDIDDDNDGIIDIGDSFCTLLLMINTFQLKILMEMEYLK